MFLSLLSLIVVLAAALGIWYAVTRFWAWLAKGKPLVKAAHSADASERLVSAFDEIERVRSMRKAQHVASDADKIRLTGEELREVMRLRAAERDAFFMDSKITWYQVVMIFFIASVLGLLVEEIWMFVTAGLTQSRAGLVWGPFSPLYGLGALLLTYVCLPMRKRGSKWWVVFLVSMVVGGSLEQFAGWAMQTFMGAYSWDYILGGIPGAITQWVAIPILFLWGGAGMIWAYLVMPELLFRIGAPTTRRQVVFVGLLGLYLALDIFMTLACFDRAAEREAGIPPSGAFDEWIDENYSNEFMATRFQNLVFYGSPASDYDANGVLWEESDATPRSGQGETA